MGEETEKINAIIPDGISKTISIIHERGENGEIRFEWSDQGNCRILVTGSNLPDELYRAITGRLREVGVEKVELMTWGCWLGKEEEKPDSVLINDHVACHLPGPLTGTVEAARGEAFISMRGAYSAEDPDNPGIRHAVLWQTTESEKLSEQEIATAKEAGCEVASPDAAGWVVCARAVAMEISVTVRIAD